MIFNVNSYSVKTTIAAVPTPSGSLVYSGKEQSPIWNDYDPEKLTISGDVSGINAGTYTASFTPKSNTEWPDGTTAAKTVKWTIDQAIGKVTVSNLSPTLRYVNDVATFTVDTNGSDGPIVVNFDGTTPKVNVSISGNKGTITPNGTGSTMVTIMLMPSRNYTGSEVSFRVTTQGYLIYNGEPCCKVIGVGKAPQSGYSAAPNVWVTQKDGYYQVRTSNSGYGMAYLDTKVDLTPYSKLTINGTFKQDSTNYNSLSAWTSIGEYIGSNRVTVAELGATKASKDITSMTSKVYIGLSLKEQTQEITNIQLT